MQSLNLLAGILVGAAALPSMAANFDFYKLGNGAGDFLPTNGVGCTGGDLCSSDVDAGTLNGNLIYTAGGITAVATGSFTNGVAAVVQDLQTGWTPASSAGLGVYHLSGNGGDDNITVGERLTITPFDQVVNLSLIDLRSEGHNFTGWGRQRHLPVQRRCHAAAAGRRFDHVESDRLGLHLRVRRGHT